MKLSTSLILGTCCGFAVALSWMLLFAFGPAALTDSVVSNLIVLLIWPSALLLIGDPTNSNVSLQAVAVASNGIFYGMLGALLWAAKRSLWGKWLGAAALIALYLVMGLWVLGLL